MSSPCCSSDEGERLHYPRVVLVRPELGGVKDVSRRQTISPSHALPLAVRNVGGEIACREKRQHLDLVRGDAEFAITIEDVFLADLGVCKKQRRAPGSVPIAILSSLPFPICRDLRELRLEAMLEIVDGHDVRDRRLEGERGRGWVDHQIDAAVPKPSVRLGPVLHRVGIRRRTGGANRDRESRDRSRLQARRCAPSPTDRRSVFRT